MERWLVWYYGRPEGTLEAFKPVRAYVHARTTDDAYRAGAVALNERRLYLGFPISAEPVPFRVVK